MQYKFLYQAIREMIICDDTFIAVRDFNQVCIMKCGTVKPLYTGPLGGGEISRQIGDDLHMVNNKLKIYPAKLRCMLLNRCTLNRCLTAV